jgi:hypothetical protein
MAAGDARAALVRRGHVDDARTPGRGATAVSVQT